jgi:phage repressor protein C with HTH and peptisase S24 domain
MVGDSMEPIIRDGSTLVIDLDDKKLVRRGIYAIATPHGQWINKHLKQSGHMLILLSANSADEDTYPPFVDCHKYFDPIIGRVVWVAQPLT